MGWFGDLFGFGDEGKEQVTGITRTTPIPVKLPDYPESDAARVNWGAILNKWQGEPGYGAIQPNWNDIWENARQKVQRYFSGGPEGPGLDSKIKANSARRGMAENPAGDVMLQRSGFQQGNVLQDIAVKMAMEEANLGEKGRTTWLSSLMQLAGLKPSYAIGRETVTSEPGRNMLQGIGDIVTSFASQGGGAMGGGGGIETVLGGGGGGSDMQWLEEILGMMGEGGSSGMSGSEFGGTDIGDVMAMFGEGSGGGFGGGGGGKGGGLFNFVDTDDSFGGNFKDAATDPQTYAQIAQIMAMFCWVSAAVFPGGWNDPKTHHARYFIGEVGPKWFKNIYEKHGERFAAYIGDKPILKALVRPVFEIFAFLGKASMDMGVAYGI